MEIPTVFPNSIAVLRSDRTFTASFMKFRYPLWFSFGVLATSAFANAPLVLENAVQKLVESDDAWAYTQTIRRTDQTTGDTVARFDPSKPAGEQWQLIQFHGRAPTASQAASWCRKRTEESTNSNRVLLDVLDLDHASVVEENSERVRFQIPLRKSVIAHVPTENFVAYAEVDPTAQLLQRLSVELKQSIRLVGGAAEVESAEGEVVFRRFGDEDARPDYATAHGSGQALFHRVNRSGEILFSDQRRVKS